MLLRRNKPHVLSWDSYVETLRKKWHEVPVGTARLSTSRVQSLGDPELADWWKRKREEEDFAAREWYRVLYAPIFQGKKVLDLGCGLGFDSITFARAGAKVTCADIVESNVALVERVASLLDVKGVDFRYLESLSSFESLDSEFEVIWCAGSFHHAPQEVLRQEVQVLMSHFSDRGRWIQLAYPRTRWLRDGKPPFNRWGYQTDGEAPWAEWYDVTKVKSLLEPLQFDTILDFEFHRGDFIWFDLLRRG